MRHAALALALIGCGAPTVSNAGAAARPQASDQDQVMQDDAPRQHGTVFSVTLDTSHPEVSLGERDLFQLNVHVTNVGTSAVDPASAEAVLEVNELPSDGFRLHREDWTTLEPGESADAVHPNLGVRLFDEPGEYTLRLRVGDDVSPPVRVRVTE